MKTRTSHLLLTMILFTSVLVGTFWFPHQIHAGTIVVETSNDELDGSPGNGSCSLREAIMNANHDNGDQEDCEAGTGDDIITLPANTYTLDGPGDEDSNQYGDLDIMGTLTINGDLSGKTIIQAGSSTPINDACADCNDRVVDVLSTGIVEINRVIIRYGRAPDGVENAYNGLGGSGGGIRNKGFLTLNNCIVTANRSGDGVYSDGISSGGSGGPGGGIDNQGTLILENSSVTNNQTGNGGVSSVDTGHPAGSGGIGGGIRIYPTEVMTATNTIISGNQTGKGGIGSESTDDDAGDGGDGGNGGGIYSYGFATLINCKVHNNQTGSGATGGNVTGTGTGGDGGDGGDGGGIYLDQFVPDSSQLVLMNTTVSENFTGDPALGGSGSPNGEDGVGGDGGGLQIYIGPAIVQGSTFRDNEGVSGGGIGLTNAGELTVTNSTISGNTASQDGGGIYKTGPTSAYLVFVTISANTTEAGDGGGIGGSGSIDMTNSILAGNYDLGTENPDCYITISSGDYNLVGIYDSEGCGFTPQANDIYGTEASPEDPHLESLADNGGPTWTHALIEPSPAVDVIPSGVNGCMTDYVFDQRGITRSIQCDVGAYEIEGSAVYIPLVMK